MVQGTTIHKITAHNALQIFEAWLQSSHGNSFLLLKILTSRLIKFFNLVKIMWLMESCEKMGSKNRLYLLSKNWKNGSLWKLLGTIHMANKCFYRVVGRHHALVLPIGNYINPNCFGQKLIFINWRGKNWVFLGITCISTSASHALF